MEYSELIMLGTGNAAVTHCYNTCFAIRTGKKTFLVDAGGGNGVLTQLEKAEIRLTEIQDMFITHAHTDHILGAVWVLRMIAQEIQKGKYPDRFQVYGHNKVIEVLKWICHMTLPVKIQSCIEQYVDFHKLESGDCFRAADLQIQCFDIASTKEKQFGFRAILPDGKVLVCLGDEPYNETTYMYVKCADWLLSEAFCLYTEREVFKPYEKHHSTALDAGRLATQLQVKNLLLYHTEDKTLATRRQNYTKEAAQVFRGKIYVPNDLEKIVL